MIQVAFHDDPTVSIDADAWALDETSQWFEFTKDGDTVALFQARHVLFVLVGRPSGGPFSKGASS